MPSPLTDIRAILHKKGLDGLLVCQPENRRYLSGYTATDSSIAESAGVLLIPARGTPFLLTDFRYRLQAEAEAAGFEVVLYRRGLLALLQKLLPALAIKRLGFESHYLLHTTALALEDLLKKLACAAVPLTDAVEKLRLRKNAAEIEKIRASVKLNEAVFQEIYADLEPGQTERQVALRIETAMRLKGAEGPSFATIIAAGPHGALPHAVPTDRPLQRGEPIVIDMGLRLDGYCSDMTRTVVLLKRPGALPDERTTTLLRLVRQAQLAAQGLIRAGIAAREVDRAARQIITAAGYGKYFGHGLGHGVGLAVHEGPALNRRNRGKLAAGMVVTVEPGIYLPGWGGIRLENMVVVTDEGCEILNQDQTFLDI